MLRNVSRSLIKWPSQTLVQNRSDSFLWQLSSLLFLYTPLVGYLLFQSLFLHHLPWYSLSLFSSEKSINIMKFNRGISSFVPHKVFVSIGFQFIESQPWPLLNTLNYFSKTRSINLWPVDFSCSDIKSLSAISLSQLGQW